MTRWGARPTLSSSSTGVVCQRAPGARPTDDGVDSMSAKTPPSASKPSANEPGADRPKQRSEPAGTSADTATGRRAETADKRVFVEIPRAGPGQGYQAPKNYDQPLLTVLSRLAIVAICLAIPLIPGVIVAMIMFLPLPNGAQNAVQAGFAWLWIPMILFVEALAIFLAVNVYREAVGSAGGDMYQPIR